MTDVEFSLFSLFPYVIAQELFLKNLKYAAAMTNTTNDFFTDSHKNLYMHNDFGAPVYPDPIVKKTDIPCYFTKPYNETGSYIVDWQMSTDEN
jgi:hypothetical protein